MKTNVMFLSYTYALTAAILSGFIVFGGGVMGRNGFSLIEVFIIPNTINVFILFYFVRKDILRFIKFPAVIGVSFFLSCFLTQIGQYAPLFLGVSVSLTVFLLYTQPIWNIFISTVFFKTKFTRNEAITTLLVIGGLFLLLSPWKNISYSVPGVILALIGGFSLAAWITISAHYSKEGIKPLTTSFFSNLYTSVPFILLLPLIRSYLPDAEISSFSFDKSLLAMSLVFIYSVTVFIGAQLFLFNAAKKVNSIHLGLIMLLEPVTGLFLDVAFLDTVLTWNILLGGAIILFANARLILKSS